MIRSSSERQALSGLDEKRALRQAALVAADAGNSDPVEQQKRSSMTTEAQLQRQFDAALGWLELGNWREANEREVPAGRKERR